MENYNSHWVVRNLRGTTKNKCACKSWIAHWRAATRSQRAKCCRLSCNETAAVGAHVQIVDGRASGQWFIVPFCKSCNHYRNYDLMYIKRDVVMISANLALTCGSANWLED